MTVELPERFHEYVGVAPVAHAPRVVVSFVPNCAAPVIVGAEASVKTPATIAVVGELGTTAVVNPERDAVTVTVRVLPMSAATGV